MEMLTLTSLLLLAQHTLSDITTPELSHSLVLENGKDQTATLPCNIAPPIFMGVYWSVEGGVGVVYSKADGVIYPQKYAVSSDAATTGDFSLTIKNLSRDDTNNYICSYGQEKLKARVIVADLPGPASITVIGGSDNLLENQRRTFKCISEGGYPAPTFIWSKAGVVIAESSSLPSDNGGNSTSSVETTLTYEDNTKQLRCDIVHILENTTSVLSLDVKYKPRVAVVIANDNLSTVLRGTGFDVSCNIDANPEEMTSVIWKRNDQVMVGKSELILAQPGGVLSDTTYECKAENSLGEASNTLNVTVHYAPEVTIKEGADKSVGEGERLELNCEADGVPQVSSYKWVKDGKVITMAQKLIKSSASRDDAGKYVCVASNKPLGEDVPMNKSIQVNINYKPNTPKVAIESPDPSPTYRAGGEIVLSCSLPVGGNGYPTAGLSWHRNDVEIAGQTEDRLKISKTTYKDTGRYTCVAANSVGSKHSSPLQIEFHDLPELLSPSISKEVNFTKDSQFQTLHCIFGGVPQPEIAWYHNDEPIIDSERYTFNESYALSAADNTMQLNSELIFAGSSRNKVDIYDIGSYKCKAKSLVGESLSVGSFNIYVHFIPEIIGYGKFAAEVGQPATLTCEVLSYPEVTSIVVTNEDEILTSSPKYTITEIEYNVDDLKYKQRMSVIIDSIESSDYGRYSCKAENSVGVIERNVTLQKPSKPDAPTNLAIIDEAWDFIEIQWTPEFDGGMAQRFIVSMNGKDQQTVVKSSFRLTELHPETEYTIKVMAKNSLGDSALSSSLTVTTDSLNLAVPQVTLNSRQKSVTVKMNSEELCVILLGTDDDTIYTPIFDGTCYDIDGEKEFTLSSPFYSKYAAKSCVVGRSNEVCSVFSENTDKLDKSDPVKWIVIGAVAGVIVVVLIIAGVAVIIMRRRNSGNKLSKKSISPPIINGGHINHVMTSPSEEVDEDIEQPYSNYAIPDNNLNTPNNMSGQLANTAQEVELQNYDYTYASVQKKSAEQNKSLNEYNDQQPQHNRLERQLSTPPGESNSDNTEQDTLDGEMPTFTTFTTNSHDLSRIIGTSPLQYHRFSNISESGYSTPDSRAKKIIYEVIV